MSQYELNLENVSRVFNIVNPNVSSIQEQIVDSTFTPEEKRLLDSKSIYWVKYQTIFPGKIFGGFAFDRVVISFLPQNLKHRLWLACAEGALGAVVTSVLACPDDMQKYTQYLFHQDKLSDVKSNLLQKHILCGDFGDHSRIIERILKAPQKQGLHSGNNSALMEQLSNALVAGNGAIWQHTLGGNRTQISFYQSQVNPQF
ncbi:MAG: hypothetical protein CENE_00716 [Candidatus Celerinatantimonas neptuna]|nr:MAG: hypothetical protein CENE_00716 [Candidatus Celerinatantimonas neptuna]